MRLKLRELYGARYRRQSEMKNKGKESKIKATSFPPKGSSRVNFSKTRFAVPFGLRCEGCYSLIAKGVNLTGIKKSVGIHRKREIWRYNIKCPCCGHKVFMDRTYGDLMHDEYKVIKGGAMEDKNESKGVSLDSDAWKKDLNKKYLDSTARGLIARGSIVRFETPFCLICNGCSSIIARSVKVIGSKNLIGNYRTREIWWYLFECPCCGQNIVMERTVGDSKVVVIDGAKQKYFVFEDDDSPSDLAIDYFDIKTNRLLN